MNLLLGLEPSKNECGRKAGREGCKMEGWKGKERKGGRRKRKEEIPVFGSLEASPSTCRYSNIPFVYGLGIPISRLSCSKTFFGTVGLLIWRTSSSNWTKRWLGI
jgi:hypothetical protein